MHILSRSKTTAVAALALATFGLIVLRSGWQAAADGADAFAEQADAAEALIRAGDRPAAMNELKRLRDRGPLATKLAIATDRSAEISEIPGTRAYREQLTRAGIPVFTQDELRVLHWFAVLLEAEVPGGTCRGDAHEKALHLAALAGYAASQFRMGQVQETGTACWKANAEESFYWYASAAEQGHKAAEVDVARMLLLGQGTARDSNRAINLLSSAADNDDPRAKYLLGVLYANGDGVRQSKRKAIELLQSAAEQGVVPAQTSLGRILWDRAVSVDEYEEARDWLVMAADQGDSDAQYTLGKTYVSGSDGEFWRFDKAVDRLLQAAESGHVDAQTALGLLYWEGDIRTHTMPPDYQQAFRWFRVAAEAGQPRAQTYLGYAYTKGAGVAEDQAAAVAWWRKAAAQNDSRAEEALGHAYENGVGVAKNVATARSWYQRAAGHGSAGAKDALHGTEFERLAREENQILATAAFFGAIVAISEAERIANKKELDGMLAATGGEWKAKYYCKEERWEIPQMYGIAEIEFRTACYEQNGRRHLIQGWLNPCDGKRGWCDGIGLGPD